MSRRLLSLLILPAALACGTTPEEVITDELDDEIVVGEGKEDNFVSVSAREYLVSGATRVTIEENLATATAAVKEKRVNELITLRGIQLSWFLNTFLITKEDSTYGGYGAMSRFFSETPSKPVAVDARTYSFTYKVQVGGAKDLITRVPGTTVSGGKKFNLSVGRVSNADLARLETNHEWYRGAPWSNFDPAKLSADQLETVELTIKPQPASPDAWLAYDRLYKDGELTIALHTGWDYHARYDVTSARNVYNWLIANGYKSPVTTFNSYLRTSGPLTKAIKSNGKTINVKVWVFHPGDVTQGAPGPDPDTAAGGKQLEDDMRESFLKREVIMYLGHSGPLYGFALANWKVTDEGDLDDADVPTMPMPKSTYQIVLANGCDTYAMGQAFWLNPNKSDKLNLNVITSTSFSNAGTEKSATRLIAALTNQTGGKVVPVKVSELAGGMDADQGYYFKTMFGIHGTDANPRYDPTSVASKLCLACTSDAGCGGDGNRCTKLSSKQKACSFACINSTGCPTNYSCRSIASASTSTIKTKQCVPTNLKCAL